MNNTHGNRCYSGCVCCSPPRTTSQLIDCKFEVPTEGVQHDTMGMWKMKYDEQDVVRRSSIHAVVSVLLLQSLHGNLKLRTVWFGLGTAGANGALL